MVTAHGEGGFGVSDGRPEEAASPIEKLASHKGALDVDRAELMRMIWVICMPAFPQGVSRESWAAESAALWWNGSGLRHRERDVRALADELWTIHQGVYAAGRCHRAFIHLPDPRMVPLPVQLGVWAMQGERDPALRLLVRADDPGTVGTPVVAEFTTDRLGTGLRCRRDGGGQGVSSYLDYAWRCEEYETDLHMFTSCRDMERIQLAVQDVDRLAHAISIVRPVA